jgi:Glycosyltransferase family 28 C-terminal domain
MATRVAWYGLGGGLGHLNRSLAILRHFRPLAKDAGVLLFMSAPYAHLPIAAGLPVVRMPGAAEAAVFPKGAVGALVAGALAQLAPLDLLVVDTFADGLHLELTPEVLGLARRRALIYREGGVLPDYSPAWSHYHTILAPYPVTPHPDALPVGTIVNRLPSEALTPVDARRRLGLPETPDGPLIMAMHAGDPGEVIAFFSQVRSACRHLKRPYELRLVTPLPLPGDPWPEVAHVYPASEVLRAADLVIAGAGYNTVSELTLFGKKALYRPFDRTHDVQAARLGNEEAIFGALTSPEDLAALIRAKLDGPAPMPVDERDFHGAMNAARVLAGMLNP